MRFRSTVTATASLSFSVLSLSLTKFVFAQNTANNEILIYPPKKPPTTKKWYLPLEYGEGRFTTGLYSGLNRFPRRRVDADKLDPFANRQLPTRKRESSSFKPGTWNWRPGRKLPAFSYRYRIINLTKDSQGSYEGMPGDYRQNYRPIPHVRFGGTFAPIPPLMGDPTQHRRGWYIKKYREKRPKKEQYNQYIMDTVNDRIEESYPSLEWVTYSWKNPYKWKYNLTKDKVRPRFGSYEAFSNYDSRFPAYEPKRRYEVIKIPEVPPIQKRSAEKEDTPGNAAKSIDINSVPSKSEDVIRNLESASSIMQSALRTARLRQEPESEISSSDYDSNEVLNSENSISLSSVYESSETNSSSSDSLIDSEDLREGISPIAEDKMKVDKKPDKNSVKKSLLFSADRKQQQMAANNMRHVRHKRSLSRKGSIEKLAKKLDLSPKSEESKWTFKNMPSQAPDIPSLSIFRLEDQPDSFWDSIYGRTKEKKGSGSSSDSDSDSDSSHSGEMTMKPIITTMQMQKAPKVHPGVSLPQVEVNPKGVGIAQKMQGLGKESVMETRGRGDRGKREKKKKKLTSEEREEKNEKKRRKGRNNFARDYSIEVPRDGADLKSIGAFRFPTFPLRFTSFVPPQPYIQPTPYVQPTIPRRPPPQRPYVRIVDIHHGKINNAQRTENNMLHMQNNARGSPHEVRNVKGNQERIQSNTLHGQSKVQNEHITGNRVDHTKHKANVIKHNMDRIQNDMRNIINNAHDSVKKKEFFANIPHLHGNKGLHRSLGLPAARRKNLERTLRFGDDRLYDSEEISENDKAEWSIGPPLNESEPVLNTEERNYVPEGAYQFPHFRNPNFDPDTAYDENGLPIFMSPNYTEPTTLKGDRIFGLGRGMQRAHGLIGQHHNEIAYDLQPIAGSVKGIKSSPNVGKHTQGSQGKLQIGDGLDHLHEQTLHEKAQGDNGRKHVVVKRRARYPDYHDDHPYSRHRMGLYMPRPSDVHYLRQGVTVPPYQLGRSSVPTISAAPYDYENRIIFKRSVEETVSNKSSVSDISSIHEYGAGNVTTNITTTISDISGIDVYDTGNVTTNITTTVSKRSKRNANPEPKKKKNKKFKKYHKQLKKKDDDDDDDDTKSSSLQGDLEMLNSITEKLKEQLVSDMSHRKANSDKQESNFVPNTDFKKDTDRQVDKNASKAVPPIHLVKQITEEIYNNLDKRYPLHKPALNSRVTVIRARPGEEDQFLPIQHAPIQVRLNKKTGEYQIRYIDKNAVSSGTESVKFFNGSVHEDKEKRKKLWQQFDEKLRNIRAGLAPSMMVTSPVTAALVSREKKTRTKRRRVVKKIVRVRRRRTTTPEPALGEEISEVSVKHKQVLVSSESKTTETDDVSDIKTNEKRKKTNIVTIRRKVGRKKKITEKPIISDTGIHREKTKSKAANITQIHKNYLEAAGSSSEEDKNTSFISEKPIHIVITSVSPVQFNISTSKSPLTSTSFTVTSVPMATSKTSTIGLSHEYRNITTTSFKPDLRNTISYSTYLYSRYHSVGTARSVVTTACLPTTSITVQHSRTAQDLETSDEFLMSSNESTERPVLTITSKSFKFTTPVMPSEISQGTEGLEVQGMTKSLESSESLAGHVITESVRRSEEVSKLTTIKERLETPPQATSIQESHRSLETPLSLSITKTVKYNITLTATTPSTVTEGIKSFTNEYSTEKPTKNTTDVSKEVTGFTTFVTMAPSTSTSAGWLTTGEITLTTMQPATETTEQSTLLWQRLPTIIFKTYSTSTSTPYVKPEKTKPPSTHGESWSKSGWYRYQPYSSRNLGGKYKPHLPATYKPYRDKQWNRYNGRYGSRSRKYVPPKYAWQRGHWLPADIPESATPMPVVAAVSTEETSLVEAETSTVKIKLVEDDIAPTLYEEQFVTSSFTEEQQTTILPITETEHKQLLLNKEDLITLSPIMKTDHTILVSDKYTHVSSSSHTPEKTVEPSEEYTISQTSVEKEDLSLSTTSHPKFLTTLLPKQIYTHHVTEHSTVPTISVITDITPSMELGSLKTASSLPVDRHIVQPPFVKIHRTLLDGLEHTTLHVISEKHTTDSLLATTQQTLETDEKHFANELLRKLDTHTLWTPYTVMTSTHSFTTLPTVTHTTVKQIYTTEQLPSRPAVPKEVPSYKGPKFEWPVFDIKNILTTVSPLLTILMQSTIPHQIHETPKIEISSLNHTDESLPSPLEKLHDTEKSFVTEPTVISKKTHVLNQSIISPAETTTISLDQVTVTPTTEDEYSLLKVVPDTDLVSDEEGVLKKIFVKPFRAVKNFLKDSWESESKEVHYVNYDEPNTTVQYDFNDIYDEPYFDKNATKAYFTKMRFNGTYVTVRTIYRRPSNFTFPPTPQRTRKPTTQPSLTTKRSTHKPVKLGFFGFMKHRAKKVFKNIANFLSPDLSDEEEEMRRMRKNVMVEEDEDEDDEH